MMHSSRRSLKWFAAACASMLFAALTVETARTQQQKVNSEQARTRWLECEYCEHAEREAVVRQGEAIVPSLIAVLNGGISPATRETLRKELEARYEQLVKQSEKNANAPIAVTKEQFVSIYTGNFDAQQRLRAAQALAAIGGQRAREALAAAAANQARDDVREMTRDLTSKTAR